MTKPTVGQKVWLKPIGNAARYNKDMRESEITKVGIKYIECNFGKFDFSGRHNNGEHSSNYVLFFDEQSAKDNIEHESLDATVRAFFYSYNHKLTLEQLRQIKQIIDNK